MPELHTLAIFSAAVLGLLLAPGPNMAFLFAHSLKLGAAGGLAVATGIFIADLVLSVLTACGVAAVVMALPGSFDVIRIAGAGYLLWLAWKALRSRAPAADRAETRRDLLDVVRRSCLNSLLNPKALVFFLVFLPQFVDPALGNVAMQLAVLGVVLSVQALLFHALLGLVSGSFARKMSGARAHSVLGRVQGLVFVGLAARLLVLDRR